MRSSTASWLERSLDETSKRHYGHGMMWMGMGGTIPFMAMLGEKFPQAQFLITGVLGPHSNAHGPNEFLHIGYAKKLTACVADVLTAHAAHSRQGDRECLGWSVVRGPWSVAGPAGTRASRDGQRTTDN